MYPMIVNHTVVGLNLAIWQDESIIRVRMSVILKKILTIMSAKQFIIRHSTFTLHVPAAVGSTPAPGMYGRHKYGRVHLSVREQEYP
jgi:hypothetical protein